MAISHQGTLTSIYCRIEDCFVLRSQRRNNLVSSGVLIYAVAKWLGDRVDVVEKSYAVTWHQTLERLTRWCDGLGFLAPMVYELVYQFTDLPWPLGPGPQFLRGTPGDSHGDRNAIRARFSPRPVSFTTALLGRVGHAQTLA